MKVTGKNLHIKREKAYNTNVHIAIQSSYHHLLPSSPVCVTWAESWVIRALFQGRGQGRASEPTPKNIVLETLVICKVKSFPS